MMPTLTFWERQSSRDSKSPGVGRGEGPEAGETSLCDSVMSDGKSHIWQNLGLDSITHSTDVKLSKFQGTVEDRRAWHAAIHGVAKSQTPLSS